MLVVHLLYLIVGFYIIKQDTGKDVWFGNIGDVINTVSSLRRIVNWNVKSINDHKTERNVASNANKVEKNFEPKDNSSLHGKNVELENIFKNLSITQCQVPVSNEQINYTSPSITQTHAGSPNASIQLDDLVLR